MGKRYSSVAADLNAAANERFAKMNLLHATQYQELLYKHLYDTWLTVFSIVSDTVIDADDLDNDEKTARCDEICEQLVNITQTRREIDAAITKMEDPFSHDEYDKTLKEMTHGTK